MVRTARIERWEAQHAEYDPAVKKQVLYSFFDWVSEAFWLEFTLDALTVLTAFRARNGEDVVCAFLSARTRMHALYLR
jgi:hypothetical protein